MHRALRLCALLQTPLCQPSSLAEIVRAFFFYSLAKMQITQDPAASRVAREGWEKRQG